MARAVIINVIGRDSTHGVADETLAAGDWDPGAPGENADYFPAIYTEDFKPDGTVGFFMGHWPDGSGGIYSAIKVNVGFIGKWDIATPYLYSLASGTPISSPADGVVLSAVTGQARILIYENTQKRVEIGYLAAGVYGIKGYADNGTTMVFEMSDDNISLAGWSFSQVLLQKLTANVGIILDSAVPIIKVGDMGGTYIEIDGANERIQSSNFVSGATGSRWKTSTGDAEFNNVVARGNIIADTLLIQENAVTRGTQLIVTSGAELFASAVTTGSGTFTLKVVLPPSGGNPLGATSICVLDNGTNEVWFTPGAGTLTDGTHYVYTATWLDGAAHTFPIGTAIADYGASGAGGLLLTADRDNAPYMDIFTHAGDPWSALSTHVRIGNLDGITDGDFGINPSGFGLYTDNVYLKGSIVTAAGGGKRITINKYEDGAFNNALVFYASGGDEVVRIDDDIYAGGPGIVITGTNSTVYIIDGADQYILLTPTFATFRTDSGALFCSFSQVGISVSSTTYSLVSTFSYIDVDNNAQWRIGIAGISNLGHGSSTSDTIGIYGKAVNDGSGAAWAGYFDDGNVYIKNNLGIGTDSPDYIVDIAESAAQGDTVLDHKNIATAHVSNSVALLHRLNTDAQERTATQIRSSFSTIADGTRTSLLEFMTVESGVFATRIAIKGGNVGIGTDSPASPLETKRANTGVHWTLDRAGTDVATIGASSVGLEIDALNGGRIKFNDDKLDVDIQMFSDDGTSMFYMDAELNRIGIGTPSPGALLELKASGEVQLDFNDAGTQKYRIFIRTSDDVFGLYDATRDRTWFRYTGNPTIGLTKLVFLGNGGNVGIGVADPDEKFEVNGNVHIAGDSYWTGDGSGVPYGFVEGDHINWTQASATQGVWYNISDADMLTRFLNTVTHDGNGKMTVAKAGIYRVSFNVAYEVSAANVHIEFGIEVNGTGMAGAIGPHVHTTSKFSNQEQDSASTGLMDLAAGATIEVAMRTIDTGNPNFIVDNVHLTCEMVGGT